MSQIPEFSLLTQTDQRLTISDIEPQLKNLKALDIAGEVFIASDKLSQDDVRTFHVSPKIKATLVKVDHRSRAVKINHILRLATGKTIILHADDFEISASAIKAHLNFHHHDKSITSICFGMAWIKDKTIYNAWLENKGVIFGYQFKENAPYEKMQFDFFYGGNASVKRNLFKLTGSLNESCEFDCTDDWLLWREMKKHRCTFSHVPKCDVRHFHDVSIKERFIALIQSGWNASHLKLNKNHLDRDLDLEVHLLHQAFMSASKKLTRPKELFFLIEQVGPKLGQMLYEKKINLDDMYSEKKIFEYIFTRRNLPAPNFDDIENSVKKSSFINLFKLFGKEAFGFIRNDLKKLIS